MAIKLADETIEPPVNQGPWSTWNDLRFLPHHQDVLPRLAGPAEQFWLSFYAGNH